MTNCTESGSVSVMQCRQCDEMLKLCVHCVLNGSKLHVHPLPRFHRATGEGAHAPFQRSFSDPTTSMPAYQPPGPPFQWISDSPSLVTVEDRRSDPISPSMPGQSFQVPRKRVGSVPQMPVSPTQLRQGAVTGIRGSVQGLRRAYNMTQRNPWTRLATKIAVGSVASALGADLSGGGDAFDASDFDNGDGVDYSPDVAGAVDTGCPGVPSTDDSADVTEWMQQETWQSVTLPQSGWANDPAALDPIQ